MTAAVIALAALALMLGGALTFSVVKLFGATDRIDDARHHEADSRIAQVSMEAELERKDFEIEKLTAANAALDKLANSLEQTLAEYLNAAPNADLAADDVRSRVLRISQDWARAVRAGEVPAEPASPLSLDRAAEPAEADLRSPDGPAV